MQTVISVQTLQAVLILLLVGGRADSYHDTSRSSSTEPPPLRLSSVFNLGSKQDSNQVNGTAVLLREKAQTTGSAPIYLCVRTYGQHRHGASPPSCTHSRARTSATPTRGAKFPEERENPVLFNTTCHVKQTPWKGENQGDRTPVLPKARTPRAPGNALPARLFPSSRSPKTGACERTSCCTRLRERNGPGRAHAAARQRNQEPVQNKGNHKCSDCQVDRTFPQNEPDVWLVEGNLQFRHF